MTSNVVDLMATLKKSLGQVAERETGSRSESRGARRKRSAAQAATKASRKRA